MGGILGGGGSKPAPPPPPPPPAPVREDTSAAEAEQRRMRNLARGRASTILSENENIAGTTAKKKLLGA